jgi:Outer membrane receptor proteins, mostly Fe transport
MILLYTLLMLFPQVSLTDTISAYELELSPVTVFATLKQNSSHTEQPLSATSINRMEIENRQIITPKDLSLTVPNYLHADYGSKMTSSIYIRGIGSRMEQPAIGLYIDNIPILNKNNYDFDFFDIRRIDILRGTQGTLYGRNTIGGIIDVHTLSPHDYQSTRINVGASNGNTLTARISTYQKLSEKTAFSIALNHYSSDGFFTNIYDGTAADKILSENARSKIQVKLSPQWTLENVLSANFVKQNGFAYSFYDEHLEKALPVNHNDPCTYNRFGLLDGLVFKYSGNNINFLSATSYQYMDDEMILDQDFLPTSMFTLHQSQRENAVTQEFVARSENRAAAWQWIAGAFGFFKHVDMNAPVMFKKDGIDELILANANAGIHTIFPNADLLIEETQFPIESDFRLPVFGFSLYHQSVFSVGNWEFTGGIRADYEHTAICYTNTADIHYRFTAAMPNYKLLQVEMSDKQNKSFFEILPKMAVMYKMNNGNIYASVARGYKTGGFNTQIFSDILQNKMMNDLMSDLGVYFGDNDMSYNAGTAISYKPEYSWNYEVGGHFNLFDKHLSIDATLFYIDCRNQQLTVFPQGKTTGRLMSNAGKMRSTGGELAVNYRYKDFQLTGTYGYTNAKFIVYDNGNEDFAGNRVPYAPINTVAFNGEYRLNINRKWADNMLFNVSWQGAGKIYWNESNSLSQPFYGLLNATATIRKDRFSFGLWGKNLTQTNYNTFYFKSLGNSFVQQGKPLQAGIFINLIL